MKEICDHGRRMRWPSIDHDFQRGHVKKQEAREKQGLREMEHIRKVLTSYAYTNLKVIVY